jgi:hypothetical protein
VVVMPRMSNVLAYFTKSGMSDSSCVVNDIN